MERLIFAAGAGMAIVFAGIMVIARNPVRSVISLVVSFFGLAVAYVMLLAPFIAVIQIIVYAGAILVLFLFVLMLLNVGPQPPEVMTRPIQAVLSGLAIVLFAMILLDVLRRSGAQIPAPPSVGPEDLGDPKALARLLFSDYLLHFEAVSVLLLAALVGAFVLARRERPS